MSGSGAPGSAAVPGKPGIPAAAAPRPYPTGEASWPAPTARSQPGSTHNIPFCTPRLTAAESAVAEHKADIARVQVPVITLELGREAALAVVCIARAGNGSLRAGLAAGVPRGRSQDGPASGSNLETGRDDDARGCLMNGTLTAGDLERLRKDFSANPVYRLAQNAVTRVTVDDVAINREIVSRIDHSVSTTLDDWKVTNQEQSGRCWLFAGLNLLRVGVMRKCGLKEFEFSQNYVMFWDKLERANYFLEAVIETADRDLDDRTVAYLLESAASDGGQWNMFAALVAKHGLVPKGYMPETQSSSDSARMNSILRYQLRLGARTVRAPRRS